MSEEGVLTLSSNISCLSDTVSWETHLSWTHQEIGQLWCISQQDLQVLPLMIFSDPCSHSLTLPPPPGMASEVPFPK